jgi:hypothetical protein
MKLQESHKINPQDYFLQSGNTHGSYVKGHIIAVQPDGHQWGNKEGLPNFIQVRVTDALTVEQAEVYRQRWKTTFDYEVVNHNMPQDGYRIRLWVNEASASGLNSISRGQVESYLLSWNAVYKSASENEVGFDFGVYESAISRNFWGAWILSIVFDHVAYDQGTGVHTIDADYSALMVAPEKVEGLVLEVIADGGQVISHQDEVIRFEVDRQLVLQKLKKEIHDRLSSVFEERQWYIAGTAVDNVIAQGGRVEIDKATFLSYLKNRMDE